MVDTTDAEALKFLIWTPEGKRELGDLGAYMRIILKWKQNFSKIFFNTMLTGKGTVMYFREHSNEPSGSKKT
jgi:hypothetical protein